MMTSILAMEGIHNNNVPEWETGIDMEEPYMDYNASSSDCASEHSGGNRNSCERESVVVDHQQGAWMGMTASSVPIGTGTDDDLPRNPTDEDNLEEYIELLELDIQKGLENKIVNHGNDFKTDFLNIGIGNYSQSIQSGKHELLRFLKESEEEKLQIQQNEERHQEQLKVKDRLKTKYKKVSQKCKEEVSEANEKLQAVNNEYKKSEEARRDARDIEYKWMCKKRRLVEGINILERRNKQLDQWFENHGIQFVVPSIDESDELKDIGENEVLVQLKHVHPDPSCANEIFNIRMDFMDPVKRKFLVRSVYPVFEDACGIVKAANESQNFIKFLLECKTKWKREYSNRVGPRISNVDPNQSTPLFESSTGSGDSD